MVWTLVRGGHILFTLVAKSGLGRGLSTLLKGPKEPPPREGSAPESAPLSPGMAALLRRSNGKDGTQDEEPLFAASQVPTSSLGKAILRISLFSADLVLLTLVARLAFMGSGYLGVLEIAICVLALVIGAWLACLALWL